MKSYKVRERNHEQLLDDLLAARGIGPQSSAAFLEPDFARDSHDPFLLPDMEAAVDRILSAQKNNEKVAVWSDYDCDGIPGGVMLTEFLRALGLSVRHYIPHRHKEGYGLNVAGLDELAEQGITLIITIDLGTTEHEQVAHAKELGIDIIVTDHHIVSLPHVEAFALLNPKRADSKYPFDGLCGAGVAWKLVQAILVKQRPANFGEGAEKWYLDLVGIATLSDMVPLVGENRMLAKFGLTVMRRNRRAGLAALLKLLRITALTLTEDDVGFMVSPRINAASRMDSPEAAAQLLATKDPLLARDLAAALNKINDERKGAVAATVKEVNKRLQDGELESPLIVMGNPNWRPGILGLVANKLAENYGKTTFLWGREGGELVRGSVRSDGEVNVVSLMAAAADIFDDYGGHHASGGFSIAQEKVHELKPRLLSAYEKVLSQGATPSETMLDREMQLAEVRHALRDLERMAPFGVGFGKPLFLFPQVRVESTRTFGKAQDHLELRMRDNSTSFDESTTISGIAFFSNADSFSKPISVGSKLDIVGHVERDWKNQPRIRVVDVI